MTVSEMFSGFLSNLVIENGETISLRYGELAATLNKKFRDTESNSANVLQVGSFGRGTGIHGISDLDMLYLMPQRLWEEYSAEGEQVRILRHVREAIAARYPATTVRVDRLVVCVTYQDFHIEVQPVFEQEDGSYLYPDTKSSSWKVTKPREEMAAVDGLDAETNQNLKRLCKMARAWKNKHGLEMGGLLLDTLAYNFLCETDEYDETSFLYYDEMCRDFFLYLSEEKDQSYYYAPGSGQQVKVRRKFQRKAKKAYNLALKAIEAENTAGVNDKWKKVFGREFPAAELVEARAANMAQPWKDTEQFIEDFYPVDIRYTLKIDCEVKQNGFRLHFLREMLAKRLPLLTQKQLIFSVTECTVPQPFELKWKVLNRGEAAQRRDCIRGQIIDDSGHMKQEESTNFKGDHVVECYAVKDGVVVAKDRIHVPIEIK